MNDDEITDEIDKKYEKLLDAEVDSSITFFEFFSSEESLLDSSDVDSTPLAASSNFLYFLSISSVISSSFILIHLF